MGLNNSDALQAKTHNHTRSQIQVKKLQLRWDKFRRKPLIEPKIKLLWCVSLNKALSSCSVYLNCLPLEIFFFPFGRVKLFTEPRSWLMGDRGEARGPNLLCNRSDAKWSVVWRGHLRPAHLDNERRCNPKLRWTHCLSPTLSSCSFPSVYSLVSYRSALAGPQAYFLSTTWSILPSYPTNFWLTTSLLCPALFPCICQGIVTLMQNIPQCRCESWKIRMISTPLFLQAPSFWRKQVCPETSLISPVAISTRTQHSKSGEWLSARLWLAAVWYDSVAQRQPVPMSPWKGSVMVLLSILCPVHRCSSTIPVWAVQGGGGGKGWRKGEFECETSGEWETQVRFWKIGRWVCLSSLSPSLRGL